MSSAGSARAPNLELEHRNCISPVLNEVIYPQPLSTYAFPMLKESLLGRQFLLALREGEKADGFFKIFCVSIRIKYINK